jgi:hypothetical protein
MLWWMTKPSSRSVVGTGTPLGNVFVSAKFPNRTHFFHTAVSLMPSPPIRFFPLLTLQYCCVVMATLCERQSGVGTAAARRAAP